MVFNGERGYFFPPMLPKWPEISGKVAPRCSRACCPNSPRSKFVLPVSHGFPTLTLTLVSVVRVR